MALFTDDAVVTAGDLLEFESTLEQTAAVHGVNIQTKISLAISDIGDKIMLWLLNAMSADPQWTARQSLGLSTVVLTQALKRWLCAQTLAQFFSEVYNLQLNTRYQAKWKEYEGESRNAADLYHAQGVGLVTSALPRPATPLISALAGNLPAQPVFVQTTWANNRGEESAPSAAIGTILQDNSSLVVGMAEGATAPSAATGWSVYAGAMAGETTKQNSDPLPVGLTWELPAFGLQVGSAPSGGQRAVFYVQLARRITRG